MARIADSSKKIPHLRLVKDEETEDEVKRPKSLLAQQLTDFADDIDLYIEAIKGS